MASIRKSKIGFVFQGINLVPDLTIRENVLSPTYKKKVDKKKIENRIDMLLEQMELVEHQKKFPSQLSGGQKQRAAICRALMNEPDILFADEPTGALNSQAGESVLDTFTEIHDNGQAVVMVTHDLKAAVRGNRIIFLRDGIVDGELRLNEFDKGMALERETVLYEFLKERGW
jgi:putative ABC transport system ATP-binding protein